VLKDKEIKQFGEYRTRRLVLEAWNKLERVYLTSERPVAVNTRVNEKQTTVQTVVAPVAEEVKPSEDDPVQSVMSDFGLYKCQGCGKMVMGYEKHDHSLKNHTGQKTEWKKIK
jgi:hypothetical protein